MYSLRRLTTLVRFRNYSTGEKALDVLTDEKTKITTLSFQRLPVNSLNTSFLTEFGNILDELEANESKGLILKSNVPHIFSGGLDLMEFYKTDANRLTTFWTSLQNTWLKLYTSSFPTVALINGHSPAGGCLLAMSCEYRVMLGPKYTIGLNEARIGIPAPFWFMDVMQSLIGARKTESAVLSGQMFSAEEAFNIGLVDQVVPDLAEAQTAVNTFLKKANSVVPESRAMMKKEFRKEIIDKFLKRKEKEVEFVVVSSLLPRTQQYLAVYFESLKKKS